MSNRETRRLRKQIAALNARLGGTINVPFVARIPDHKTDPELLAKLQGAAQGFMSSDPARSNYSASNQAAYQWPETWFFR